MNALTVMKILYGFMFLAALSFALSEPPHQEVFSKNTNNINSFGPALFIKGPLRNGTLDDPTTFAGAKLIGVFPSVDERILASEENFLFWAWNVSYVRNIAQSNTLSSTGCAQGRSTGDVANYSFDATINFRFNNYSRTTRAAENILKITVPLSSELETTDGDDQLKATLTGTININQLRIDIFEESQTVCTGLAENQTCSQRCVLKENRRTNTIQKPIEDTVNYTVEGTGFIQFLRAPVLREQWWKNNLFNNIIFSKRKFYLTRVKLDGSEISNASLYYFIKETDALGVEKIKSRFQNFSVNSSLLEYSTNTTPIPLERGNDSFALLYEMNITPYSGIGYHFLEFEANDHFNHSIRFNETIQSRYLSVGGILTEEGAEISGHTRESLPFRSDTPGFNKLALGLIGFLILIVSVRFFIWR